MSFAPASSGEPPYAVAVAAVSRVAPAPGPVATGVEEVPAAVGGRAAAETVEVAAIAVLVLPVGVALLASAAATLLLRANGPGHDPIIIGIAVLAVVNFAFKAAGPALLVDREPSPTVTELITAMSSALLAGLVTVELAGHRWADVDWTVLPGLAAAASAYRAGASDFACVVLAVLLTSGLRVTVG